MLEGISVGLAGYPLADCNDLHLSKPCATPQYVIVTFRTVHMIDEGGIEDWWSRYELERDENEKLRRPRPYERAARKQ